MLSKQKLITIPFCKSRLEERKKELSVLLALSDLLSEPLELAVLLEKALSLIMGQFGFDAGRVYLMAPSGDRLILAAYSGIDISGLEEVYLDEGFSGKSARTKSFIAQHVSEFPEKERAQFLAAKGLEITICVPLIVMDRVSGVLNLAAGKDFKLTDDDVDLMMIMAHQIGVASSHVRAYQDLEAKLKEIEEKKETIKFFAYSASHDLKSPAVGLCGLMKRLHGKYRDLLDEKGKAHWDQILKASQQILSLVEQINGYIGAREAPLHISRFSVQKILATLNEEYARELEERGICWVVPDTVPDIFADELRVTRVFRNLLDNALKYGGKGMTEIRVAYEERDQHHVFAVSDDGVGIEGTVAETLFQPFQRHETARGTEGSGMGLAIAKEIAKRHHGDIWIDSEVGRGATFYFSIGKRFEPQ